MTRRKLHSWKRIAFPAMLFIAAAVFLLGEALIRRAQLKADMALPCRMTVSVYDKSDVPAISALPEVVRCSEVYTVTAGIRCGIYSGNFVIAGADPDFVDGDLISGSLYPNETAMPYLVLNKAAAEAFSQDGKSDSSGRTAGSDRPQENGLTADVLTDATALADDIYVKICGIVSDGDTAPRVYMSRSAARQYLQAHGLPAVPDTAWVELASSGACPSAAEAITALGCSVVDPGADTASWEIMRLSIRYQAISACIAMAAAILMLCSSVRLNRLKYPGDYGMTDLPGEASSASCNTTGGSHKLHCVRVLLVILHGSLLGGAVLLLVLARQR